MRMRYPDAPLGKIRAVCLRADPQVVGSLAFRLIGSKASGVFVYNLHSNSHQAQQLENGDKLLVCNDVPLHGLTCEQVANVVRLSMFRNGTVWLTVAKEESRKDRFERRGSRDRLILAEETTACEKKPLERLPVNKPLKPLTTSSSLISGFAYEAQLCRISTQPSSSSSFTSSFRRSGKRFSWRSSGRRGDEDRTLLLPANDESDDVTSIRPSTFYCMDINGNTTRVENFEEGRYRCPICLQYIRLRRWHMLKHEWISSARRLLPASASDFFEHRDSSVYSML